MPEPVELPSSATSAPGPPPYPQLLPARFTVGGGKPQPFITIADLEAHLCVLGAFSRLKESVEQESQSAFFSQVDPAAAWAVFLCRAVYRFERWIKTYTALPQENALPPLDVLMVWHSYMLNPLTYLEDVNRVLPQLKPLTKFPLREVARWIDPQSFEFNVPGAMQEVFESTSKEPFAMPIVTNESDRIALTCPCCDSTQEYAWPWIDNKNTGWAQREFRARCPNCKAKFDHEAYGVRRFCNEVVMWRDAQSYATTKDTFFLAGFKHPQMRVLAVSVQNRLLKNVAPTATGSSFAQAMEWKMQNVEQWCMQSFSRSATLPNTVPPRVAAVLRRYSFPGPFSIELTGAVMRQATFIQKMVEMHWTERNRFRDNPAPLVRAVARYHAFLNLMCLNPGTMLVPTLDIDLGWHTHQLNASAYHADTKRYLVRTPDHDDKIEENALSKSFDKTAGLWKERYGVPYSLCGCASKLESRTGRALLRVFGGGRSTSAPPDNRRPDLISTDMHEDGLESHPSEHNSVFVQSSIMRQRRRTREELNAELLEKRARAVDEHNADAWSVLREHRARSQREAGHSPAFFYPDPYWGVGYPFGPFGFSGSSCTTSSGGAVTGPTGGPASCAIGAGGAFCGSNWNGGLSACGSCGGGVGGDSSGGGSDGGCGGGCGGGGCGGG